MKSNKRSRKNSEVIVIAGASGVLARAFQSKLHSEGTAFITIDKSFEKFSESSCLESYVCDLLDEDLTIKTFKEIGAKYSVVKLVCFAGKIHNGLTVDVHGGILPTQEFIDVVDGNLVTVFNIGKAFISYCLDRGVQGNFVAFSSVNSSRGKTGQAAYAASKSALESLLHTWVLEYSRFGIRFNALAPGYIESSTMQENMSRSNLKDVLEQIPLGKLGSTEDINHALQFILDSKYVNGTILFVDGGLRN